VLLVHRAYNPTWMTVPMMSYWASPWMETLGVVASPLCAEATPTGTAANGSAANALRKMRLICLPPPSTFD
jgi:hypothetical protein